jgi:hypothetical protein
MNDRKLTEAAERMETYLASTSERVLVTTEGVSNINDANICIDKQEQGRQQQQERQQQQVLRQQ